MKGIILVANGRFYPNDKFTEFTFNTSEIYFFRKTDTGNTILHFKGCKVEIENEYEEFKNEFMSKCFDVEIMNDTITLMAGYLSNHITANISPETLIKDCQGIFKKIASENNTL
jgi:hypothetical protein